jgi:ligand-binding SRPBCC domain-containing protein
MHRLVKTTLIKRPISEVFDFFSKAENLNALTPPELEFSILTPLPIPMKKGTLIDYRIKLEGIPFRWRTLISDWQEGKSFTDEQIKGPYRVWKHTHSFVAKGDYTEMTDEILYLAPGWFLEPIIHKLFVKKRVEAIFEFRESKLNELFPEAKAIV